MTMIQPILESKKYYRDKKKTYVLNNVQYMLYMCDVGSMAEKLSVS